MDSTGTLGCIQVSHRTSLILAERGYVVKERGIISVKGKGQMLTFYVIGRKISRSWRFGKTVNQGNNSLAEVVYGMVRARKRRTARRKGKGKVIQQSNTREHMSSQPDSDPVSADQVSSREFSDNAKSRLLMPPPPPPLLQIDPSSETDEDEEHTGANVNSSMEVANKFIRNGNEIRRSLRRINSLTRRKLSPSSIKDAMSSQTKSPTPISKSPKRKHSQGSIDTGTGNMTLMAGNTTVVDTTARVEPDFNNCSARLV